MQIAYSTRNLSIAIFLIGILSYSMSILVLFNNDEIAFIQRTEIKNFNNFVSLFNKQDYDGIYYRPIGNVVSGIITSIANYNAPVYRAINIMLNAFNGVLVFLVTLLLFRKITQVKTIAFFTSVLFLLNPINNYAVIWHTALFERVFLLFYLISLLLFLQKSKWSLLSLLAFLAALLSKEMALSFPLIIFIISFYISDNNKTKKGFIDSAPYLLLTIAFIVFRIIAFHNNIIYSQEAHSYVSVISIIKNYAYFVGALLFPFFLKGIEPLIKGNSYIILLASPAAIWLLIKIYQKNDKKIITILSLLIIASILPVSRLFMRWYLYLPSVFFSLIIVYLIVNVKGKSIKFAFMTILLCSYLTANIYNQVQWVKISKEGDAIVSQLRNDYLKDIQQGKTLIFINIPAKINDIPLFQLGFDYHLRYYLKSSNECIFIAKEEMKSLNETLVTDSSAAIYKIKAENGNLFKSGDKVRYANISIENRLNNTIYLDLSKIESSTVFIFNNGKFIKIKDN